MELATDTDVLVVSEKRACAQLDSGPEMKHRSAACPSCGGPVEFKTGSSLVTICDFCQTAVARGDKKVEDFGKVADVGETNSGLRIGLTGRFSHKDFYITGRVRYDHPAGGVWDEWYLVFSGETWGWLTEAQGRFYLMFQRRLTSRIVLPEFDSLSVGTRVKFGKNELSVREKGIAVAASAEGEIPWAFHPGSDHKFVDLSGENDLFATFEYGDQPHAYVGKEVRLADLGIEIKRDNPEDEKLPVAALQLNCPHCGGQLVLRAPDESERVTCQNCHSLLDAKQGKLSYLQTLKSKEVDLLIPLGTSGEFFGDQYTVIGFIERFALYEGKTFPWSEYLLHSPIIGFRWLVCNENHWSFVEPISGTLSSVGKSLSYNNRRFQIYDRGTAYVRYVIGEFYWKVSVGESVTTADYISPPQMISFETSFTNRSEEVNISLGNYLYGEDLEAAFKIRGVRRPWGVGPIQPAPKAGAGFYLTWMAFLGLIILIQIIFSSGITTVSSDPWLMAYALLFVSLPPFAVLFYAHYFERQRWINSDYNPYATE